MTSKTQGRRYCVVSNDTGRTVEGGFFSRVAAEGSASDWTSETGIAHYAAVQVSGDKSGQRTDRPARGSALDVGPL